MLEFYAMHLPMCSYGSVYSVKRNLDACESIAQACAFACCMYENVL